METRKTPDRLANVGVFQLSLKVRKDEIDRRIGKRGELQ